jgi:hypothetical protein
MDINLSKSEIQVIIAALQPSPHPVTKDLIGKLEAELARPEPADSTRNEISEPTCANDPVNW